MASLLLNDLVDGRTDAAVATLNRSVNMKSICILFATALTAAACSHAQPPPPPAPVQPMAQSTPPPAPPPEAAPAPVRSVIEIAATSVYFAFDSSELSPQARAALQTLFELARQRPDQNLRIEGNCDERGTREYNLALGQRRADAAKTYLINLGLVASRFTTISYGKERPRALGHDEASWRENRRADVMAATETVSRVSR
jgi:peptidoglycan-associated lipoprotein